MAAEEKEVALADTVTRVSVRVDRSEGTALLPGDTVDHYVVRRVIGEGGMGVVYLAHDTRLGRRVALKVIHPELVGSAKAHAGFLHEARMTARFSHPHIVTVYAVGVHGDCPYLALEHIDGEPLSEAMARGLSVAEALAMGRAIAGALVEAHGHGVLHRDLKPNNVLVGADGRARVLDFGLAKHHEDAAPPSSAAGWRHGRDYTFAGAGTPPYMAPEQWQAGATSTATDVWALGVVMYELFAGRRPFEETDLEALQRAVCAGKAPPRLDAHAKVPRAVADIVERCLSQKPGDRPTAEELVALLDRAGAVDTSGSTLRRLLPYGIAACGALLLFGLRLSGEPERATRSRLSPPVIVVEQPAPNTAPATATTATVSSAAPPASTTSGARRQASIDGMLRARAQAAADACSGQTGPMHIMATVSFVPESGASIVNVSGSSPAEQCVRGVLASASTAPFAGQSGQHVVEVRLRAR